MKYKELTEQDLTPDEKHVFGRIIDMWSLGMPENRYEYSTESKVVKYAESDGLPEEEILKIINDLEARGLIHRETMGKESYIEYKVEASKIVKELQKTTYVHSREHFTPPHR
ncbi:MAG: hypothetical protein WB392_10930 [Methanotrichaceae archaeon]